MSLIPFANTVTAQTSPGAKSAFGSSVNVVPVLAPRLPLTAVFAGVRVPLVHAIWNHVPDTVTGSLNTMLTLAPGLTLVALSAGTVDATDGAVSTGGGNA